MSFKVNRIKSGAIGTSPQHTAAMRAAAGHLFGCTTALRDLGVIQGTGAADSQAAMVRWAMRPAGEDSQVEHADGRLGQVRSRGCPLGRRLRH